MKSIPTISVVIPVYNAENCLSELDRRLHLTLAGMQISYEVIYVEDCGTDLSWQKIVECASSNKRVKGFKLSRNFGQHHAITAGLDQAHGWVQGIRGGRFFMLPGAYCRSWQFSMVCRFQHHPSWSRAYGLPLARTFRHNRKQKISND